MFLHVEQERFRMHDPHLNAALEEVYQYITTKIDPVLTKVLEEVLLYQPDQTADFLANAVRGTLNLKKYNYVVRAAWIQLDAVLQNMLTPSISCLRVFSFCRS